MTKRILLIDDETALTRALSFTLEACGHHDVRTANTGQAGIDAARAFRPHIIFLDLMMPDMDGAAVAAALRQDPELRQTPIIFLTALVQRAEQRLDDAGAPRHLILPKPASIGDVLSCIEALDLQGLDPPARDAPTDRQPAATH